MRNKCEIKNITGHSSERGLDAYDSGNEDENICSVVKSTSPPLLPQKNLSHDHHRNNLNLISPRFFIQHPSSTTTFFSE